MAKTPAQVEKEKAENNRRAAALVRVEKAIADRHAEFAKILPKGWTVDRFAAQARLAVVKQSKLLDVNPASIVQSLYTCAELGLVPGGALGHGWIVPYGENAQWVTGYKGLIYLAGKAGIVKRVHTTCVYEHEVKAGHFEHNEGLDRRLVHKVIAPAAGHEPEFHAAYAVFLLDDGQRDFFLMYRHQIEKIRNRSAGYKNAIKWSKDNPWISDFDPMAMKTVIRHGLKNAPLTSEAEWTERLARAFQREDEELIEDAFFEEPEKPEESKDGASRTDKLKKELAGDNGGQRLDTSLEQDAREPVGNDRI